MPFCRECGKEVQDDWKTCPYCSADISYSTQSLSLNDTVVMGDLTNKTTYVVNSSDSNEKILNFLKLMLKKYRKKDFEGGLADYNEAKKINYDLAEKMYFEEFSEEINKIRLAELKNWIKTTRQFSKGLNVNIALSHWVAMHEIYNQIKEDKIHDFQVIALQQLGRFYSSWTAINMTQDGMALDKYIMKEYLGIGESELGNEMLSKYRRKLKDNQADAIIDDIGQILLYVAGIVVLFMILFWIISI